MKAVLRLLILVGLGMLAWGASWLIAPDPKTADFRMNHLDLLIAATVIGPLITALSLWLWKQLYRR